MTLKGQKSTTNPRATPSKIKVVVKRRRKAKPKTFQSSKKGLPNLTKEVKEAPPDDNDDNDNDDDDEFGSFPFEDAIPCDTLLAFQSLIQPSETSPPLSLHIPLKTSLEPISCALESQLVPLLQQNEQDHDSFAMVARELPDLFRKNTLRKISSIAISGANTDLTVLVLTQDFIRGVWDAHDSMDTGDTSQEQRELQRSYTEWFVRHLHRWTGRLLAESNLQRTWNRQPPTPNLPYSLPTSLPKALEYLQTIQVLMAHNHSSASRETTYQLWLPEWGAVVSAVQTAQTKLIRKLQQTYQKEVSEKTLLQQPFYHGVSTRLLVQLLQDTGKVRMVPKPFGKFLKLVQTTKSTTSKGKK